MAVAFTQIKRSVYGTDRVVYGTLAFSGSYATGGEAVTPATFGLTRIDLVVFDGAVVASDLSTACSPKFNAATSKIAQYESGAANAPLAEKGVEAYVTGANVNVIVFGA